MVIFLVCTIGATLSCTLTVAVLEEEFPNLSETVSVTELLPMSLQSKTVLLKLILSIAQLSEDPLSISEVEILALPLSSSWIVIFLV